MVSSQLYKPWLKKADEDFNFASSHLEDEENFFSQICFFFQQAAEKYLKAYIVAYNLPFKKIHDLGALLKICVQKEKDFLKFKDDCDFLTDFYVETRYPVHWPTNFTRENAIEAKNAAKKIGDFVKRFLEV